MTSPAVLLANLQARGVNLSAHGDRLAFDAPEGVIDNGLLEDMRANKWQLLALLAANDAPQPAPISPHSEIAQPCPSLAALTEAWEERAAIMEYDGGMSREEANRAAWLRLMPNTRTVH